VPRPNPPRRRPRQRRRNAAVVKVPEGQQPRALETPPPRSARAAVAPGPPADPDVQWSRRSLAIMLAIVAVVEVIINLIGYPSVPAGPNKPTLRDFLVAIQPIPLVGACFVAMPITKYITGEKRYLRVVETAVIGVVVFFIWFFLVVGVGALIGGNSSPLSRNSPSTNPTPLPNVSVSASPNATATPSLAPSSSPSGTASPVPSGNGTSVPVPALTAQSFFALIVVDIASYALTVYVYPPLYRRLRMRPRPPRAPPNRQKR